MEDMFWCNYKKLEINENLWGNIKNISINDIYVYRFVYFIEFYKYKYK